MPEIQYSVLCNVVVKDSAVTAFLQETHFPAETSSRAAGLKANAGRFTSTVGIVCLVSVIVFNTRKIKKSIQFFIKLTDFSIIIQYSIWVIAVALRNPKLAFVGNGRRSVQGVYKGNGVKCASELVNGEYPWKYHASALEPKNNIHLKFPYRPLSHGGFP